MPGRPKMGLVKIEVGLPAEMLAAVDARRGDESRVSWIRDAVRSRLDAVEPVSIVKQIEEARPFMGPAVSRAAPLAYEPRGDERKLLEALRELGPMTEDQVMAMWKWSGIRAMGAAMLLKKHKLIRSNPSRQWEAVIL